jgi:hypothetical protein
MTMIEFAHEHFWPLWVLAMITVCWVGGWAMEVVSVLITRRRGDE